MTSRRPWISVVAAVIAATAAVYAQDAEVNLVEVPVTVVDGDGNTVRGLTAKNFLIYDEGVGVPVEHFEVVDLTANAKEDGSPLPPSAYRNFLLMFDLANSSPEAIVHAAEAAKELVANQLGERDAAAISVITADSGAKMITNFTRDKALLTSAIETLGHPKSFTVADPLMISAIRSTAAESAAGPGQAASTGINAPVVGTAPEQQRARQGVKPRAPDIEEQKRLRLQFTNMSNVARALDTLRGQKQIILLSEGFDARLVQGRRLDGPSARDPGSAASQAEQEALNAGQVWGDFTVDTAKRLGTTSSSTDLLKMTEWFRRCDVVLHAIDLKGLGDTTGAANLKGAKGKADSLHLITAPTGGSVFKTNDLSQAFNKMLKQQEVVYLLGFRGRSSGKPGAYHALKITAKGVPAKVTHRAGYYEPSAEASGLEQILTLGEILLTDAPIEDVTVSLGATTLPGPGGKARVPVVVEILGKGLLEELTGNKVNAQLFLYAFNESSQVVDFLEQRISVDLSAAGDTIRKGGVRYYGSLKMAPGKYAVKALVRVEETGRIGFRRGDLEVPAFDKAAVMPPLLFEDAADWAMLVGPSRGDDYVYPFAAGEAHYIPKSHPEVAPNGDYKVALFLYRVPLEDLLVTPTLVSEGGSSRPAKVTLLGRTSADDQGAVKLLFVFKPESIGAGNHELRFDLKTKDGDQSVVSLPFVVR